MGRASKQTHKLPSMIKGNIQINDIIILEIFAKLSKESGSLSRIQIVHIIIFSFRARKSPTNSILIMGSQEKNRNEHKTRLFDIEKLYGSDELKKAHQIELLSWR